MNRQHFARLTGTVLGTGAITMKARLTAGDTTSAKKSPPLSDGDAVRANFYPASKKINMAGYSQASRPKRVRAAIEQHRRGLDACPSEYYEENAPRLEASARSTSAGYLAAKPDHFVRTESTSQGLGTMYTGLKLRRGQELVSTEQDHSVTENALRFHAERTGTVARALSLYDHGEAVTQDASIAAVTRAVTPKAHIAALTWLQSVTGVKMPIGKIAQELTPINANRTEENPPALLCADGVHGLSVQDFTIPDLGCHFFIAGCRLFGPHGTALVWGNRLAWNNLAPTIPGNDHLCRHRPEEQLSPAAWMTPGGFHPFAHRWALTEAFQLHTQIGKARVAGRIHDLNLHGKRGLVKMPRIRLRTPLPANLSSGMSCLEMTGFSPKQCVSKVKDLGVQTSTTPPYKYEYARLTPGLWNTPDEVEQPLRIVHSVR